MPCTEAYCAQARTGCACIRVCILAVQLVELRTHTCCWVAALLCCTQLQSFVEGIDEKRRDVDLSTLSGHILLLGVPASTDGLLVLLAVLRSKRLLQWRPVVIIDSNAPSGGGSWEAVAQFKDVYFVQVRVGFPSRFVGLCAVGMWWGRAFATAAAKGWPGRDRSPRSILAI